MALLLVKGGPAIHNSKNNMELEDDEKDFDFLPLPPKRASKTKFPPGCSVIICLDNSNINNNNNNNNNHDTTMQVLYGSVQQVGIDLDDRDNDDDDNNGGTLMLVPGDDLVFAVGTAVWFLSSSILESDEHCWQSGMVLGSEQPVVSSSSTTTDNDGGCYSVTGSTVVFSVEDGTSGMVYNTISPDQLIYRGDSVTPPAAMIVMKSTTRKPKLELEQQPALQELTLVQHQPLVQQPVVQQPVVQQQQPQPQPVLPMPRIITADTNTEKPKKTRNTITKMATTFVTESDFVI